MTNSRSSGSRSRGPRLLAIAVAACMVLGAHVAEAGGRKRVVVLDFEGPKSEKFHDDLVRLIKKTHTVVPTDKWNGAAEQLDAGTLSEKNVKKVAKKLKVDAIVEGKIEKRRDEFIIRIKLRAGKSGELIGDTIDTKAEGPRIDGRAQRDLKDELVGAIDNVEPNHFGAADDDDDAPVRKTKKADDEDEDRPAKKTAAKKSTKADDEDEDKPAKKAAARKTAKADDEDEDRPARRSGFSKRLDDERGGDRTDKRARKTDDEDDRPAKKTAAKKDDDEDKLPPKKTAKKADEDKPPAKKTVATKDDDEDKLPPKKPVAKADEDKPPAKKPVAKADEDKLPPKKTVATKDDDEDKLPAKKTAKKADEPPAKKAVASKDDGEDKLPPKKPSAKKVATRDDEDSAEAEAERRGPLDNATALSPGERALDAVVGLSLTMRRMGFTIRSGLRATPSGYAGIPVPGGLVDVTLYPLALGHSRGDQLKNIGVELLYDRVIKLNSQDKMTGMTYSTVESRFALNGVYRYPLGSSATAPVAVGTLGFERQSFNILGPVDIPDVKYSMVPVGAGIRFPLGGKLTLSADAKLLVVLAAGQITDGNQYGDASVIGFEGDAGGDYLIKPNLFLRAAARIETIGFSFKGTGTQSYLRDGDPETVDVKGGRDNYFAGMVTVGYIY
jgi:hypothetical protein